MSLTVLASGNSSGGGSGSFITGSIAQLAELALNVSIGQVSASELESFINPAAYQAEAGQPEGTKMELDITGWTVFGTDYSPTVAAQINSYWQQGQFTVNGEQMQAWPGAGQIAYGGNDTLTVQYIKGQIWVLYVGMAVAAAWVAMQIFDYLTGGQSWSIKKSVESVTGNPSGNWWQKMNIFEKGAFVLVVGGIVVVGGYEALNYWEKLSIAKAGRSTSSQNFYIEGR